MSYDLEEGSDGCEHINIFFDISSFPKLEELKVRIEDVYASSVLDCIRIQPPRTVGKLAASFPKLKKINFDTWQISRHVANYLGKLRKETGCKIHAAGINGCKIEEVHLSTKRQRLLDTLGIDREQWKQFCKVHTSAECYADAVYWGLLPVLQFKRIAYAAALETCSNVRKLDTFVKLCEAEVEGTVMTVEALNLLKTFMETKLKTDYSNELGLVVKQQFTWTKINRLIDYV
jgi:hypothetical protein